MIPRAQLAGLLPSGLALTPGWQAGSVFPDTVVLLLSMAVQLATLIIRNFDHEAVLWCVAPKYMAHGTAGSCANNFAMVLGMCE